MTSRRSSRRQFLATGGAAALTLAWSGATRGEPAPGRGAESVSEARMKTRPIPRTGEQLPCIGLGTWQTFDVGTAQLASRAAVLDALFAAGGRVIDSSPMYGRSEAVVGKLLASGGYGERAFRATKVWTRGRARGQREMERSLRLMGTAQSRPFALMQVHNLLDVETHLQTLAAWKAAGLVRYIGVTHYHASAFGDLERWVRDSRVDFVQLPYSVTYRHAERRLLPAARDAGVAVLVNRPFDGGGLIRRLRGKPLPGWAREIGAGSWAQVLLKWILGHDAVTCPIPGTSKARHMIDNAAAGLGPVPDAALRARIAAALSG